MQPESLYKLEPAQMELDPLEYEVGALGAHDPECGQIAEPCHFLIFYRLPDAS
jgi:hypothetical protein